MKKSLALLLALALIFAFPVTASAAETTEAKVPVTKTSNRLTFWNRMKKSSYIIYIKYVYTTCLES